MAKKPEAPAAKSADAVVVRMYRIGHGDCFLLSFPRSGQDPFRVLIDCGYKPNSPGFVAKGRTGAKQVTDDIRRVTGGKIDLAIVTHEHQDHVNGITEQGFEDIDVDALWLAWTEDPDDDLAKRLRARYRDALLQLAAAGTTARAFGADRVADTVSEMLELELGESASGFAPGPGVKQPKDPAKSENKKSIRRLRDRANKKNGVRYLKPHEAPIELFHGSDVRIYVLGPPRDEKAIEQTDPRGNEAFPRLAASMTSSRRYFLAAASGSEKRSDDPAGSPFASIWRIRGAAAAGSDADREYFAQNYGSAGFGAGAGEKVGAGVDWRRIDGHWLDSAERLALAMNDATNNSSLVLAFELAREGKVLLFAGDAQAGNWRSWTDKSWKVDGRTIDTRDLLSRTVLYKVGHHGSHNATLKGAKSDEYPNLSWMATGKHAREYTAMITAVREWAITKKDGKWDHPLPAIKAALMDKAEGRVLQTDTDFAAMKKPDGVDADSWDKFTSRVSTDDGSLYFDLRIDP